MVSALLSCQLELYTPSRDMPYKVSPLAAKSLAVSWEQVKWLSFLAEVLMSPHLASLCWLKSEKSGRGNLDFKGGLQWVRSLFDLIANSAIEDQRPSNRQVNPEDPGGSSEGK